MQRLLITIPFLFVLLTGCGNTPTNLAGPGPGDTSNPGGGTVVDDDGVPDDGGINDIPVIVGAGPDDSLVLDSDGDGYSDDLEINSTPGTDPLDATDNPDNVRDTDGDGCSDYDELNFANFCDNDPNSPASSTCNVSYYNSDFGYGFDLPVGADLHSFDENQEVLFEERWVLALGSDPVLFVTLVMDMQGLESLSLSDYIELHNNSQKDDEVVFLTDTPIALSNGDTGNLSTFVTNSIVTYQVTTIKNSRAYSVSSLIPTHAVSDTTDALVIDIIPSLCVE